MAEMHAETDSPVSQAAEPADAEIPDSPVSQAAEPADAEIPDSPVDQGLADGRVEPELGDAPAEPELADGQAEPELEDAAVEPELADAPAEPELAESPASPAMDVADAELADSPVGPAALAPDPEIADSQVSTASEAETDPELASSYQSAWPASAEAPLTGAIHHIELWVPNLDRAIISWGWLLTAMGYRMFQDWPGGRSWRSGDAYIVVEQSPARTASRHDRCRPGLNHLAFHVSSRDLVEELTREALLHGWRLMFTDQHPFAGGPQHYASYLEDADGFEVELVAG